MIPGISSLRRWLSGASRQDGATAAAERWVVIDTETAGLDPDRDPLLAIGAVAVDGDGIRLDDSFEVFVRSAPAGNAANIVVHGIGHAAQASGTPPPAALAAFREWTGDAPRVGFHADFDRAVLRKAFRRAGVEDSVAPWLDLAPLAAALAPDALRRDAKNLDDWLSAFGIECGQRHNAGADALATAELLLRLRAIGARQGRSGFAALARTARQGKWLGTGP
jgi:DNA polymerase-3 subunit epsilon